MLNLIKNMDFKKILKENVYIIVVLGIFQGLMIIPLIQSIIINNGHIVYFLDDTYIHMAIAKNFSLYGSWGINKNTFTSTTSSLLYPLLLSFVYVIFGVNEIAPLVLNLIFANLLLIIIYYFFKKEKVPTYLIFLSLILIIVAPPLATYTLVGLEHILHSLITVIFIYYASKVLCEDKSENKKVFSQRKKILLLLAPLVPMVRFEGMFLIMIAAVLIFLKKERVFSIIFALIGFLPILIYGLLSVLNGWYFFPNSIIIKGNISRFDSLVNILDFIFNFGSQTIQKLVANPQIFILLLLVSFFGAFRSIKKRTIWNMTSVMSIIFIWISLTHISFAWIFWHHINGSRYDVYLIISGVFILILEGKNQIAEKLELKNFRDLFYIIKKSLNSDKILQNIITVIFVLFAISPLISRGFSLAYYTPVSQASNNINDQQYQMGLFLKKYYNDDVVAVNDIGAVNFLADIECIDLWGLADKNVAEARINGSYSKDIIRKIAEEKECKIAIIYVTWFTKYGGVPQEWSKIGSWTSNLADNIVCGGLTVSFFAVDPEERENLKLNLQEFSSELPSDVIETGKYTLNLIN